MKKYGAEFFGTFWLVLGGCGSAVLASAFPNVGIGLLGVSIAFGLTVLTMAFAIGHISGCHLNPAVSIGCWAGGRFPAKELLPYIVPRSWGRCGRGGSLSRCQWKDGFRAFRRFCIKRLWCSFTRRVQSAFGTDNRSCHDHDVHLRHPWLDRQAGASGVRPNSHRLVPDPHPSDIYPHNQYFRESGPKHRRCRVCGWLGNFTALAVLGGTDCGCIDRRADLSPYRCEEN